MTKKPSSAAAIIVAKTGITAPQAAPDRVSGADIVVARFTAIPAAPKLKPVSAQSSTGEWTPSAETLAAIKTAVEEFGEAPNRMIGAHILIAACIESGIDAGKHIRQIGVELDFIGSHIGVLLHADGAPWQKGPDGRYKLI